MSLEGLVVPRAIAARKDINSAAKLVWAEMASRMPLSVWSHPRMSRCAQRLGVSRATVTHAVRQLEAARLLDRRGGRYTTDVALRAAAGEGEVKE